MGRRVTLATIAEQLGVSRTTVSNAYNRPDQLSGDLRDRILATAKELGYAGPDPMATVLRRGRAGAIGLVEKSLREALTDQASLMMLAGVAEACDEANVALVLVPQRRDASARDDDATPAIDDVVRTALVDGIVAHCDALDDDRRELVLERGLPLVILDGRLEDDDASVGVDDEGGARAVAAHLTSLGHRNFAVLAFSPRSDGFGAAVTDRRMAGYRGALADAGLDPDAAPVVYGGHYSLDEARAAADALWSLEPRPTAVLAMSDVFAAGVIASATEAGLRVPDDVSVAGFDDAPIASFNAPAITTVRQPHAEKGATAVRLLLDGAPAGERITLPVELVLRASTAPPPAT